MRSPALVLAAALLVPLASSGCNKHQEDHAAAASGSAATPTSGWHELTSAEGGFSIQMVDGAKMEREKVKTAIGEVETVTWLGEKGDRVYFTSFVTYPSVLPNVDGALDGARDGAVKNINGKVVSEQQMKVAGHAARDLVVTANAEGKALVVRARLVMTGAKLYTLQVLAQGGGTGSDPDATRYFDSFQLKGAAP